jgi:hypothetical protein
MLITHKALPVIGLLRFFQRLTITLADDMGD